MKKRLASLLLALCLFICCQPACAVTFGEALEPASGLSIDEAVGIAWKWAESSGAESLSLGVPFSRLHEEGAAFARATCVLLTFPEGERTVWSVVLFASSDDGVMCAVDASTGEIVLTDTDFAGSMEQLFVPEMGPRWSWTYQQKALFEQAFWWSSRPAILPPEGAISADEALALAHAHVAGSLMEEAVLDAGYPADLECMFTPEYTPDETTHLENMILWVVSFRNAESPDEAIQVDIDAFTGEVLAVFPFWDGVG